MFEEGSVIRSNYYRKISNDLKAKLFTMFEMNNSNVGFEKESL